MLLSFALVLSAALVPTFDDVSAQFNLGASLSEEDDAAEVLRVSLNAFLTEARTGSFTDRCVDPADLTRYGFFFKGLRGLGEGPEFHGPSVLKSYTIDGESYFVTVAFTGTRKGQPFILAVVELKAEPRDGRFLFTSPFRERTADFSSQKFGTVNFHHRGDLDESAARSFAAFKEEFCSLTETPSLPLDYFVFRTLDELLKCYGYVHDARKCNFLAHDLGFADDEGRVYVTGTNRADYSFGFVEEYLEQRVPGSDELYRAFAVGMSTYYGGYGLSADSMDDLKAQFRAKLKAEPAIDFLAEFRKGRKASIQRHFSFYVMSAFLFEEVLEQRSFKDALALAHSGKDGERFFEQLDTILGINESNFHATILRLIRE